MKTKQLIINAPAPAARGLAKTDERAVPGWMDCTWKRVPCGQMTCPVCGRQLRARAKHIARGEDPDSMEAAFADVAESFSETVALVKQDAERMGIDLTTVKDEPRPEPPQPHELSFYRLVAEWCDCTRLLLKAADVQGAPWVITEHFDDIMWYTHTLQVKTYRQLTNCWEREHAPELYSRDEHAYTRRVLNECCGIMARALRDILPLAGEHFVTVSKCARILARLREHLLKL